MADAGKSVQRDALPVALTDKKAFGQLTGTRVAEAAFAAAKGGLAAVERSGLGFHIVRVDAIQNIAATPLASVRAKLAAEITAQKETRAIAEFVSNIEDDISNNATFDEVTKTTIKTASKIAAPSHQPLIGSSISPTTRETTAATMRICST